MGSMFRSEKMTLCQVFLAPEAAYNNMADLGELGCVQFRDVGCKMQLFYISTFLHMEDNY